jgi:putative hydrolase of the HAD superfamily
VVLTNSPLFYAERVLEQIGVAGRFNRIVDIVEVGYRAKPDPYPYQYLLTALGVSGSDCLMFEDSTDNLKTAKALGFRTVLLSPIHGVGDHIDSCYTNFAWEAGMG